MKSITLQFKQTKCNFCFNWFSPLQQSAINICQMCFQNAIHTKSFKVCSPHQFTYYKIRLIPQIITEFGQKQKQDIQNMIAMREQEIQANLQLWANFLNMYQNQSCNQVLSNAKELVLDYQARSNNLRQKLTLNFQKLIQKSYDKPLEETIQENPNPFKKLLKKINKQRKLQSQSIKMLLAQHSSCYNVKRTDKNTSIESQQNSYRQSTEDKQNIDPNSKFINEAISDQTSNLSQEKNLKENQFDLQVGELNNLTTKRGPKSERSVLSRNDQQFFRDARTKDIKYKIFDYISSKSNINPVLYRILTQQICDAVINTNCLNGCIELIGYPLKLQHIDCYLNMFDWSNVTVLKLIKTNLSDEMFKKVIDFLANTKTVTLALSNNYLSQFSILYLQKKKSSLEHLKNIYLGNNMIYNLRVKKQIKQLKNHFLIYN